MLGIKIHRQEREEISKKVAWGHWFVFFNCILYILIGSRYAFLIDWPDTLLGKVYFFISLFGHFSFIVFAFYLLIFFPLSFIIKNNRTYRGLSVIVASLGATLMLVDCEIFAHFHFHISSVVWNLLVNPENGELARQWQLFFVPMPLILLLEMVFSKWSWQKLRSLERQKWLKSVGIFFVTMFLATHFIYAWADATLYRPITMQKSNFPLSYPMTARSFLERHGLLDKERYQQQINNQGRADALSINYPKNPLIFGEQPSAQPNIVIINLAGWRKDSVTPEQMPYFSKIAQQGTEFKHHYSTGNSENVGLTGLFYGLDATYTESILRDQIASVFISHLHQLKYNIGLFLAPKKQGSLLNNALFFNEIHKHKSQYTLKQFNHWQQKQTQPWFAFLSQKLPLYLSQQEYNQRINQFDLELHQIFQQIDLANTLVIVTATQGYNFDNLPPNKLSNRFSRDLVEVPMFVFWKALKPGKVENLTSHTDVVPALMQHLFNVQNPISDYAQGYDLFDLTHSQSWVLAGNYRWNVIITNKNIQYHIDNHGNYQKYSEHYQKLSSSQPPLGLFLDVFKQESSFLKK